MSKYKGQKGKKEERQKRQKRQKWQKMQSASVTTALATRHSANMEHVKGQTIELILMLSNNLGIK